MKKRTSSKICTLISCAFWIFFSERWQSTLFQTLRTVEEKKQPWLSTAPCVAHVRSVSNGEVCRLGLFVVAVIVSILTHRLPALRPLGLIARKDPSDKGRYRSTLPFSVLPHTAWGLTFVGFGMLRLPSSWHVPMGNLGRFSLRERDWGQLRQSLYSV